MKFFLHFLFALTLSLNAIAQDTPTVKPASIGFRVGMYDFKRTNHTEGLTKSVANFGFQYIQGWNKKLDFISNLSFSSFKYPYYTSLKVPKENLSKDYVSLDFNFNYKFLTDEHAVVPYLTAGMGLAMDRLYYYTAYAPMGAGLQIKANYGSYIFIQATHNAETSYLTKKHNSYSISYSLPINGRDRKPVMIPPAPVAMDSDNDGVVDSLDKCPTIAGTVKYNGCPIPDTDNDGVNDEQDKCPTIAGTVKYNGCPIPDTDKDGVNDEQDKCPTVAGLSRYGGCPIPDTDKDGVNDEEDKCPNEPGITANNGCPDIQPLLNEIAHNFKFKTGKSAITKDKLVKVDAAILELNKYTNISLEISGNTDNVGSKKLNQKLSERRAAVVYAYLVKKGIDSSRLIKQGFADTKPVATNKTAKGRAENRRTDLNAKY
jgi:OOP family OmpA-OmpF porin